MSINKYSITEPPFDQATVRSILTLLFERTGYDFSVYSDTFIRRRLNALMGVEGMADLNELLERIHVDNRLLHRIIQSVPIYTTELFRDSAFFRQFREQVVPILRTYPYLRIWHAGCSTGEEAYSMAILLKEEGLYDRAKIYATDLHEPLLEKAKNAIYPLYWLQPNQSNYVKAGGNANFAKYYSVSANHLMLDSSLKQNIVFAQHNLVTDGVFNEFNVILCRNVLIYFNWTYQNHVHRLLYDSLMPLGILVLGNSESIRTSGMEDCYKILDSKTKMYQRVR